MTVEAALGIGSVVLVLGLVLAGLAAVIGQLRCTDAAAEAARLVARGDRQRAAVAVAEIAPPGARLTVRIRSDEVRVEVSAEPLAGLLPIRWLRAEAFAVLEPGVRTGSSGEPVPTEPVRPEGVPAEGVP